MQAPHKLAVAPATAPTMRPCLPGRLAAPHAHFQPRIIMNRPIALAALLLASVLATVRPASAAEQPRTMDEALAAARERKSPVLLDFHAPWCYSCYYMASHVLTGPDWESVKARAVVMELDADAPEGAQWMKKLHVRALPSYVVLSADGTELGRILAEQTRPQFYGQIDAILAGNDSLEALQTKAAGGDVASVAAVLAAYHARYQASEGLQWFASLPAALRDQAADEPAVSLRLDRLQLLRAATASDVDGCVDAGQKVLAADLGCDRPYELDRLMSCTEKMPTEARRALLAGQRPALERMLSQRIFVATPSCADQRSAVFAAADLYDALGDAGAKADVLDRAIALTEKTIDGDVARDRNLADNLRVYMTAAERTDSLDALMPKLIAAYPDDYVYAYRYGRSLLERGKPEAALPYLEQAAAKAYGANRLTVASYRVKALKALNRPADARRVVAETLAANGPWFPEEAAKLKAQLQS